VNLHENEVTAVDVLAPSKGEPFAAVRLGDRVSVYLPGYGTVAAKAAVTLADQLLEAAARIRISLGEAAQPAAVQQ
jgi:hypothetical protein